MVLLKGTWTICVTHLFIYNTLVFDETNHCSMCAQKEPIGSRQRVTKWVSFFGSFLKG